MTSVAIRIQRASVTLDKHTEVIKDMSVQVPSGKIIGLIGPSGAGKTTLMRCLVGRQRLSSGRIEVLGQPAGAAALRSRLSYMTQEVSVYRDLTVCENLTYFATIFGVSRRDITPMTQSILQTIDMADFGDRIVGDLSGGQKQRVSLAVALIGQPELMVLDEPTVGLDPVLREQLWKLFHQLAAAGKTLVVSSHVMDEAERCDDLLLLRDGRLLAHAAPADLCHQTNSATVEQAFLRLVESTS